MTAKIARWRSVLVLQPVLALAVALACGSAAKAEGGMVIPATTTAALPPAAATDAPASLARRTDPDLPVTLYAGPERSGGYALFAPRLATALEDWRTLLPTASRGTRENLAAVLANPAAIAFAQYDNYRRFTEGTADARRSLEFYGDVPLCVLAIARAKGPWVLPPSELPADVVPERVDIGPADADTAESLEALVRSAPKLASATVENRGGARALSRLRQRATDVLFVIEYPHRRAPIVGDVLASDDVAFVPSPAHFFTGARSDVGSAFVPTRITVPGDGFLSGSAEINTVCTPFGVVVNTAGNPDTLDLVVSAVTNGELLAQEGGLWSSLANGVGRGWRMAVDAIASLFD